jgi:hypothetical protein
MRRTIRLIGNDQQRQCIINFAMEENGAYQKEFESTFQDMIDKLYFALADKYHTTDIKVKK